MADARITELTGLAGATVDSANDELVIVDVSDSTMAASGTDKKLTPGALALAMFIYGEDLAPGVSAVIPAARSTYIYGSYEISNGQTLELASGGFMEIG